MSVALTTAAFVLSMAELQQRSYSQQSPKYWSFAENDSQSQVFKMCIEVCDLLPKDLTSLPQMKPGISPLEIKKNVYMLWKSKMP